ncbi:hypothetical protein HYV84_04685 [Candidatus Woesearchaeota archaeon]|nr:hypothetical protein [Candidatus Woesearchaeota archaeon]
MPAKAFSPGNITLFFMISPNRDPRRMGSLGLSFATSKGAWAAAERSRAPSVYLNGKKESFPTLTDGIAMLANRPVMIKVTTELPLGCGFGMSGACTLAALLAINKELRLGKSSKEIALLAHQSEVMHRTGLGSVTAEYLGGVLLRNKPGKPLTAMSLPLPPGTLFFRSFGKLKTSSILDKRGLASQLKPGCSAAFRKIALLRANKKLRWESIIPLGKEFSLGSGLLRDKKLIRCINQIEGRGGFATMALLGKTIISTKPFPGSKPISVSLQGARVIS